MAKLTKPASYERFFRNAYAILDFDARSELNKIKAPTLILSGDQDLTVGNEAPFELNQGIEGSKVYIYNGLGHGAYEEAKDFYDRVFKFINEGE
jgi:pimeloyl-ACP methyl ester carboxylesterase